MKAKADWSIRGNKVHSVSGEIGIRTGGEHHCQIESCRGKRLAVRWPDGKHTFPCTRGMKIREDGDWQLIPAIDLIKSEYRDSNE